MTAAVGLGAGMAAGGTAVVMRAATMATREASVWYEKGVLNLFGIRFEPSLAELGALPSPGSRAAEAATPEWRLDEAMGQLLDRADNQTTGESRRELFAKMIDQIVPDEAKIISALSDGSSSPLISVYRRSATRHAQQPVLENISLIGRSANLALPHLTPNYVDHLLAMGLLEVGPEDRSMDAEYEILSAEMAVISAISTASRAAIGARVDRATIRLSLLGRDLWAEVVGDAG